MVFVPKPWRLPWDGLGWRTVHGTIIHKIKVCCRKGKKVEWSAYGCGQEVVDGERHVHGLMNKVKGGKKRVVECGWLWSESDSCGHQMLLNITRRVA